MNHKFDLQHLDVKPQNLFLVANHIKVADFGLVNSLASGKGVQLGAITPLYAAPELFLGKLSRHSDQYSSAIAFQEALTGTLPFNGENSRQLLAERTQEETEPAEALPASEIRPIIARALAKNPDQRFPSCTELVRALLNETTADHTGTTGRPTALPRKMAPKTRCFPNRAKRSRLSRSRPPGRCRRTLCPTTRSANASARVRLLDNWKVQVPSGKNTWFSFFTGFSGPGGKTAQEAVNKLRSSSTLPSCKRKSSTAIKGVSCWSPTSSRKTCATVSSNAPTR